MNPRRTPLMVARLLLALAATLLASCVKEPEGRLRIGTYPRPGFELFFLARSLGCYDDQRLHLVEFPSAAEMLMAYRNHAIDAATVTTDDAIRLVADGEQLRIVLVLDYSQGVDAILAKPEIPNVAALKGRSVAVESNALGAYVLARALESAGLKSSDVRVLSRRADRMERELSGNADAIVTYEPYRSKMLSRGAVSIYDSRQMPLGEITGVLIAPKRLATRPPPALYEVARGWFQALKYLGTNAEDAAARMAGREGLAPKEFSRALKLLNFPPRKENAYQLKGADAALPTHMREMAAFMWKHGMLTTEVDPFGLRTDILLRGEP